MERTFSKMVEELSEKCAELPTATAQDVATLVEIAMAAAQWQGLDKEEVIQEAEMNMRNGGHGQDVVVECIFAVLAEEE